MGLTKTRETDEAGNPRFNEDGSPRFNNSWTPLEGDETIHVVQTGPINGTLLLADGTAYDVTPDHIQVKAVHVDAIHYAIAKAHESSGKLTEFVHGPNWRGTPATVTGDETDFTVVPGEDAPAAG
jgi:hypothetical protein